MCRIDLNNTGVEEQGFLKHSTIELASGDSIKFYIDDTGDFKFAVLVDKDDNEFGRFINDGDPNSFLGLLLKAHNGSASCIKDFNYKLVDKQWIYGNMDAPVYPHYEDLKSLVSCLSLVERLIDSGMNKKDAEYIDKWANNRIYKV